MYRRVPDDVAYDKVGFGAKWVLGGGGSVGSVDITSI